MVYGLSVDFGCGSFACVVGFGGHDHLIHEEIFGFHPEYVPVYPRGRERHQRIDGLIAYILYLNMDLYPPPQAGKPESAVGVSDGVKFGRKDADYRIVERGFCLSSFEHLAFNFYCILGGSVGEGADAQGNEGNYYSAYLHFIH